MTAATAQALAQQGYRVLPVRQGSKTPAVSNWPAKATADPAAVSQLWGDRPYDVGIATGQGVVVVDLDVKNGANGVEAFAELGYPRGYTVATPSGGQHLYYRTPRTYKNRTGIAPGIDVRSDRGYVKAYEALPAMKDLPPLPEAMHHWLTRTNEPATTAQAPAATEDFAQHIWDQALVDLRALADLPLGGRDAQDNGWDTGAYAYACQLVRAANTLGPKHLATARAAFDAAAPPRDGTYDPAHKWDSAVRDVGSDVLTGGDTFNPEEDFQPLPSQEQEEQPLSAGAKKELQKLRDRAAAEQAFQAEQLAEATHPQAVDLDAIDVDDALQPQYLRRTDGQPLLYPGLTHSLAGDSGSGKTWLAYWEVVQVLRRGDGDVLVLDYEGASARSFKQRMQALGWRGPLKRVTYYNKPGGLDWPELDQLLTRPYAYAVIDGVNAALQLSGLPGDSLSNSNDAITRWHNALPGRIAEETGAAVLMIDHVTKSREGRNGFAIGGQAKRAALTGAAYGVTPVEPFGVGRSGGFNVVVNGKDREGVVLGALNSDLAAYVQVTAEDDSTLALELQPPLAEPVVNAEAARDARLAQLTMYLRENEGQSQRLIVEGVGRRKNDVTKDLQDLEAAGFVHMEQRGRAKHWYVDQLFPEGFTDLP